MASGLIFNLNNFIISNPHWKDYENSNKDRFAEGIWQYFKKSIIGTAYDTRQWGKNT